MGDQYGSDYITITDDDGKEYELEVLHTLEYNGHNYLAVIPADGTDPELDPLQVSILRESDEDGERILSVIEDPQELQAVYDLLMDSLYEED